MENATKNLHTNQAQFEILLNFMTDHPHLAKGYVKAPDAKQATNNLWKRLAEELNAAGPPVRVVVGWKKVWADHKTHLKSKLRKNRVNLSGTGGGPAKICSFTALEEGVIELLDMREAMDGISGVRKFGVNTKTPPTCNDTDTPSKCDDTVREGATAIDVEMTEMLETNELVSAPSPPRCSSVARTPNRNRSPFGRIVKSRQTLLEKQVSGQMDYHKRSTTVLGEINDNLKSLVRYKKKQLDLEEKKYQLAKRKFEEERKWNIEKQKLKVAKLELKKRCLILKKEGMKTKDLTNAFSSFKMFTKTITN